MPNSVGNAYLLDLTRLMSRAGRVLTGVDRVELAYLNALMRENKPVFGLVRTMLGYVLLDRAGMLGLRERIEGRVEWGAPDRLSQMSRKLSQEQKRAQSDIRKLAMARVPAYRLRRMLSKYFSPETTYFNVGHSNITDRVLSALKHGPKAQIAVMIHDTIPLDFSDYQRPESVDRFELLLRRTRIWANLIIYNSHQTARDAARHMENWGPVPRGVVAHLGVTPHDPAPGDLPKGLPPEGPYFVTVGTIEPRKNHALLLDVWERMVKETAPQQMPHLVICGHRGWNNEEVFFRLERSGVMGLYVHEVSGLSDGAVAALIEGAAGALYPSFTEGYGLPQIEAAMANIPLICADLPVYREILGDIPVYASLKDSYLWQRRIIRLADDDRAQAAKHQSAKSTFVAPTWEEHFNIVLKMT